MVVDSDVAGFDGGLQVENELKVLVLVVVDVVSFVD